MEPDNLNVEDILEQRVGIRVKRFIGKLEPDTRLCKKENENANDLLILAPVSAPRCLVYDDKLEDVAVKIGQRIDGPPSNQPNSALVAVEIGYPPLDSYSVRLSNRYQRLFCHALFLDTPAIYLKAPNSQIGIATVASIINTSISDHNNSPCILLSFPLSSRRSETYDEDSYSSWHLWTSFKSYVGPFAKVGVCLELNDDIFDACEELMRWTGEKVQTIIIHSDRFITAQSSSGIEVRLSGRCKEFIRQITLANSFKLALVVDGQPEENLTPHVEYLKDLFRSFQTQHPDELRFVNDRLFIPLQPLASNLSSSIYSVFEIDKAKYTNYESAMLRALQHLLPFHDSSKPIPEKTQLVLMVLGAGRGPLVDAFINALRSIERSSTNINPKIKIFALDKNPSSIIALKYKHSEDWSQSRLRQTGLKADLSIEVVESDMRVWEPNCKAHIIATELLGSLADNELSPECIDGTWRFSTPATISIPQAYSSFIAPISCQKIWQELYVRNNAEIGLAAFDRIHVCRFANIYTIDAEQRLFNFEHCDISQPPVEGQNERYTRLSFLTRVQTICHGFAGYFKSKLYGDVVISTVPSDKTPTMESWFPMYIPIEQPVHLSPGDELVLHFWRKESSSKVWYEWVVTSPERTRIHSMHANSSAISKLI